MAMDTGQFPHRWGEATQMFFYRHLLIAPLHWTREQKASFKENKNENEIQKESAKIFGNMKNTGASPNGFV